MLEDSEGLHEVANAADSSRKADIVFVHGLGGSSHRTWRYQGRIDEENFFWPAVLGQDLPDCAIWTVGYPAGLTASFGAPGMIIEKRAGNLAQKLTNAGVGNKPLIFITHSLGGLVVKALLVRSQTQADEDRKRIACQTQGIVFCATPHRGSEFANAAAVLGTFLGGTQEHLKELRSGQEPLNVLHDEFVEWQRRYAVPVCSYAESIGLFRKSFLRSVPLGLVVPRDSANPNIAGHTVRDVDEDHLTLVKPKSRKSDVYAGVLRFVNDTLNNGTNTAIRPNEKSDHGFWRENARDATSDTRFDTQKKMLLSSTIAERKHIPTQTKLRLFSEAAGHCQRPSCLCPLFPAEIGNHKHIAEITHVIPHGDEGPLQRKKPVGIFQVDSFENLILLCPTCHAIVDKDPDGYSRGTLLGWKSNHLAALSHKQGIRAYEERGQVRRIVLETMAENKAIWNEFAPADGSRFEYDPECEAAKAWEKRVRGVILPNHFRIQAIVKANLHHLTEVERQTFAQYQEHVRGLSERHVCSVAGSAIRYPAEMDGVFQ